MAADLTTADVYEDASLIGQDIERVIERFGHDAVIDLMPKIISVLEKLELVVAEKEKNRLEIAELKLENERLYTEIKREASQRRRLDEVSSGFDQYFIILCRNARCINYGNENEQSTDDGFFSVRIAVIACLDG